jgi:hypothetical protein
MKKNSYALYVTELFLMKNKKYFQILHKDASIVTHICNHMRDVLRLATDAGLKNS